MFYDYLISAVDPAAYDPSAYRCVVVTGSALSNGNIAINITHIENPVLPGDDLILGCDPSTGEMVEPFNAALYAEIRPLGNAPASIVFDENFNPIGTTKAGKATGELAFHSWAGAEPRHLGSNGALYPDDNQPFVIEVRHKYFGGNANPAWDGYGWRAEIVGLSSTRDPANYAIGVYNDPECTDYWYTTGAFSEQPSDWQTDGQGDPVQVWATEYNPAFLTGTGNAEPVDTHHAVLLGSAQEGYSTLKATHPASVHNYWEHTQPGQANPTIVALNVWNPLSLSTLADTQMTAQHRQDVRQALRDLGIPQAEISACGVLAPPSTYAESFIGLIECIRNGTIAWPPL